MSSYALLYLVLGIAVVTLVLDRIVDYTLLVPGTVRQRTEVGLVVGLSILLLWPLFTLMLVVAIGQALMRAWCERGRQP